MTPQQKERKRENAREYMRRKRLDPVFREEERIKNLERFRNRDKAEYNEKKKEYRENILVKFQNYEREYSQKARAEGRKATRYRKRFTNRQLERFAAVFINGVKMFWKGKNQQLHYNRKDDSPFVHFQSLSGQEKFQLKSQIKLS